MGRTQTPGTSSRARRVGKGPKNDLEQVVKSPASQKVTAGAASFVSKPYHHCIDEVKTDENRRESGIWTE